MNKLWIDFRGYQVSDTGEIRNKHGRIMKVKSGFVILKGKMYRVKNLVANLHLGVKPGKRVGLKDPEGGYGIDNLIV